MTNVYLLSPAILQNVVFNSSRW